MVDRPLSRAFAVVLLLTTALLTVGPALPASGATLGGTPPIHGSITGRTTVPIGANETYYINGTGGPAFSNNGTEIGSLRWTAKVSGADLSGVSLSPNSSTLSGPGQALTHLKTGSVAETLILSVTINSTFQSDSKERVFNLTVQVVVPYVVHALLVVGPKSGVLGFDITVELDGRTVGTVSVPAIKAGGSYNLTYDYATPGLSPGEHTFTLSLPPTGLVRFAGGTVEYSQSFYVVGAAPDYPLYVLVGAVVFFGVLFIFVTRVAARRRPAARR